MSEAKTCPKCKLVNPPSAQRCDCGYDFVTRSVHESYVSSKGISRPDGVSRVIGCGCLLIAIPLLISGVFMAAKALNVADTAEGLGMFCGSFLPGGVALAVAIYLLRGRR
jgi:hypothetical protein